MDVSGSFVFASRSVILTALLAVSAGGCGGGGGGGSLPPGSDALGLGYEASNAGDFAATPGSDARITFGTGTQHLPGRVDLRDLLPPVDSQQNAGSCVGWSTAYYLKTGVEKKEMGWSAATTANQFSPAYIYNQRANRNQAGDEPDGTQGGMQPYAAMTTMVNLGCCTWATMPYTPNDSHTQPSSAAHAQAANFKARSFRRLGAVNVPPPTVLTRTVIDEIRGWLNDEGTPVSIAITWYESMHYFRDRGPTANVVTDAAGGASLGGHAITIVGYDDNIPSPGTGSFLLVNSHGLTWGADGFAWIPYTELRRVYWEGYGQLDLPNTGPPPPPPGTESNDTIAGAQVLSPGSPVNGQVGGLTADPADWWKFTVGASSTATLSLSGLSLDVDLKLTDGSDQRLASSENGATSAESIVYTFQSAGTYYVKVYPYDDGISPYSLSLSLFTAQNNDDPLGATVLATNQDNLGNVGGTDPRDWWSLGLSAGQQVLVTMTGLSADIDLYVYRASDLGGDWWLQSWNGGSASESLSFTAAYTGTYYVLAVPYGGATSNYTLRGDLSSASNLRLNSWSITYWDYSDRVDVTVNNLQVGNIGTGMSPPFRVGVGVSNGTVGGSAFWLGSETWVENTGLPAGFVDTWTSGSGSVNTAGLPFGFYHMVFQADSGNAIVEPNEYDNFSFSANPFVYAP